MLTFENPASTVHPQLLSFGNLASKESPLVAARPSKPKLPVAKRSFAPLKAAIKNSLTSSSNKTSKRGVCFAVDADDKVVAEVSVFTRVPAKYHADLYYSDREKGAISFLAKSQGETFLMDNEGAVEELERAFLCCCRDDIATATNRQNLYTICYWSMSEMRGLEDVVTCEFHQERSLASAMILDYQACLQEEEIDDAEGGADELLRAFSENVSARSREFASKVGAGDAFAAQRCYETKRPKSTAA